MQEVFSKALKELKNKRREMNNILEEINNRLTNADKWPGGENAGNHSYRTEYKKKDWKKMKTA